VKLVGISGKKRKEYLKGKIDELKTDSKIKNITDLFRGNSNLMKGYQPITNIVQDGKGDLVTDSYSILARRRTISLICSVYIGLVMLGRQIHTVESLVPGPSTFEV